MAKLDDMVKDFLAQKRIAVVGVSDNARRAATLPTRIQGQWLPGLRGQPAHLHL